MAHNTTLPQSVATCFDAQTYLAAKEYENGSLNPDLGGACTAIASSYPSCFSRKERTLIIGFSSVIVINTLLRAQLAFCR